MDPLHALQVGARSGFAADDVDDFVTRMDMVSQAMEEIKNGTFDPATCKIPGYKTPEQEEAERLEQLQRATERKRQEEERKRALKHEERENWWMKAKLRFSMDDGNDGDDSQKAGCAADKAQFAANRALAAYKERDANDYSMWSKWEPRDPATLEENAEREAQLEKARNREFEANNPEFCNQFKEDLEKRQKSQSDRERVAEKCKEQGNACYKKKQYESAIQHYMKALEASPFNIAVLTNISQSYLRLEQLDDSIEFSTRALFINPDHVKALSRRAAALHIQKQWSDAAVDMERAIVLEPGNQDLVEQHSVIVGDYEDSIAQGELHEWLTGKSVLLEDKIIKVEEVRFVLELLNRMDEPMPAALGGQVQEGEQVLQIGPGESDKKPLAKSSWASYELLLPFLERNESVRTLIRTSGELTKLCDRLATMMESAIFTDTVRDDIAQQVVVNAMLNCAAAAMRSCSRNQVVMYRNAQFRKNMIAKLEEIGEMYRNLSNQDPSATTAQDTGISMPWTTQASILRCCDEAVELKSWKRAFTGSRAALRALLELIQLPQVTTSAGQTRDRHSMQQVILAASGICFTLSSDEHGIQEFVHDPASSIQAIATSISRWEHLDTKTVSNLLGLLTNLSTVQAFRDALEALTMDSDRSPAQGLACDLLNIAKNDICSTSHTSTEDVSSAERALAALLNLSFHSTSRLRHALITCDAVTAVESILRAMNTDNCGQLLLVLSRAVSVLCRLHTVLSAEDDKTSHDESKGTDSTQEATTAAQLTHRNLLELLYNVCLQALSTKNNTSANNTDASDSSSGATPSEAWQLCAQIWCHVGWCVHEPSVRMYLREKRAMQAMFHAILLANGQDASYHGQDANARERLVGNIVKVLIAMQADCDAQDAQLFATKTSLETLVEALRRLPDGLARKNVAILLAKLCQSDESVKDQVRALRGIEMMLTVSQSLKQQQQQQQKSVK